MSSANEKKRFSKTSEKESFAFTLPDLNLVNLCFIFLLIQLRCYVFSMEKVFGWSGTFLLSGRTVLKYFIKHSFGLTLPCTYKTYFCFCPKIAANLNPVRNYHNLLLQTWQAALLISCGKCGRNFYFLSVTWIYLLRFYSSALPE